jgi:adenylate cyclase
VTDRLAQDCSVLIVDVAGSVKLRREIGDVAAGRQVLHLLDSIIAAARERGVSFIKAYGDDVLAVFEHDAIVSAAEVAIHAQRLAHNMGLQLYAGFHRGDVQFRQTDGHADAVGQTINFVARLHKLTEDAPGQIFIVEETLALLPEKYRSLAQPFGQRMLKGLGKFGIWTLGWQASDARTSTVFAGSGAAGSLASLLVLKHRDRITQLAGDERKHRFGRSPQCELPIADPELRISTMHLVVDCIDGYWFVQDISRNGSWMKSGDTEMQLPYCQKAMLPISGSITLGRPSSQDPARQFTIDFSIATAAASEAATRS